MKPTKLQLKKTTISSLGADEVETFDTSVLDELHIAELDPIEKIGLMLAGKSFKLSLPGAKLTMIDDGEDCFVPLLEAQVFNCEIALQSEDDNNIRFSG